MKCGFIVLWQNWKYVFFFKMAKILMKCIMLTAACTVRGHVQNGNDHLINVCRNGCKTDFGNAQDDLACSSNKNSDCSMCWDMCELLVVDPFSWSPLCESEQASLCTAGCRKACSVLFHSHDDDPSSKTTHSTTAANDNAIMSFDIVQKSIDGVLVAEAHMTMHDSVSRGNVHLAIKDMSAFVELKYQVILDLNSLPVKLPSLVYNRQYYIEIKHESLGVLEQLVFSTLLCDVTDHSNTICQTTPKVDRLHSSPLKTTYGKVSLPYSSAVITGLVMCMTLLVILCVRHCQHQKSKQKWTRTISVESRPLNSDTQTELLSIKLQDISPVEYV